MSMNFNSHFSKDLENMIRLKVSLGGAESTYLDRAQNFDRFCLEKYPDADRLTEPLALSWIKDAGTATGAILSRLAFERGFAAYLTSVGKPAYVLPDHFASGRSIFVPYIFTDGVFRPISGEISAEVYRIEEWDTVSQYHSASVWYDLARYFTATVPEMAGAVESGGGRKTEENHLHRWENHAGEQAEGISAQPYRIGLVPGGWILPWAAGGGRKEQ